LSRFLVNLKNTPVFFTDQSWFDRVLVGQGNSVSHGRKRPRYRCKTCGKTFSAQEGTPFAGLRKPVEVIVLVVTRFSYGCPVQAIVHAYALDERTVARWRDRAGRHCERVHHALLEQGKLDLVQGPPDEIRVKGLALMVSTRLWVAGIVSPTRDTRFADRLMAQVRACGQALRAVLLCTDGWAAYPGSIRRAFREKVKETAGRGRACLRVWPQLHIGTVIKHTVKKRVVEVTRRMVQGSAKRAAVLLRREGEGTMLNTAFIERTRGTMRERWAPLTRKCRHAAHRLETLHTACIQLRTTYNFCWAHQELGKQRAGRACTPAMAAGLTDHVWSLVELLSYQVAPALWVAPKRRGRPRTRPLPDPIRPKRQRGRPRKVAVCTTTDSKNCINEYKA
jgi:hypothetical protein